MKSVKLAVCAALLLLGTVLSAGAVGTQQTVVLSQLGDALALTAEDAPAAWETPTLKAGEALTDAGLLTLKNTTNQTYTLRLDEVALPYGNTEALTYLNHLHLVLRQNGTVLYNGVYSRINDGGGLQYTCELEAGESAQLEVYLRCDYTAPDVTGFEDGTLIDWKFYTVVTEEDEEPVSFTDPALREVLIAAAIALALLGGVAAYEVVRRSKR